jgi:hypothetical protein
LDLLETDLDEAWAVGQTNAKMNAMQAAQQQQQK